LGEGYPLLRVQGYLLRNNPSKRFRMGKIRHTANSL